MSTPELIERIRGAVERLVASPMGEDPDSPYTRLLELVKVPCFHIRWPTPGEPCDGTQRWKGPKSEHPIPHKRCKGTSYVPRSWDGMPGWWLATLLVSAAVKARLTLVSEASMGTLMEDPDKAGAAVLAALERREPHGQV